MKVKQFLLVVFSALLGSAVSIAFFSHRINQNSASEVESETTKQSSFKTVSYINDAQPVSFTHASSIATPAVVHVTTSYQVNTTQGHQSDIFQYFFGTPQQRQPRKAQASGSGVIISADGYIITNNHVIDNANDIKVNLSNNSTYSASLIGTDKDTDLALIKIEEKGLPYLNFANSDSVEIGEWVLAVGNPFNLASTVTAGIVSAKGRNINILENIQGRSNTAIESFIQTDAAVNPGNSGGALVNTKGDLIGINTAIATPTGTYAGYSFAVPSNIASKVVSDLKEYGAVQRAFIGVNISSVNSDIAKQLNLKEPKGVYLNQVIANGAADEAGLKSEDVIIAINNEPTDDVASLQEKIAAFNPGDKIEVSYVRNGKTSRAILSLKNKYNEAALINFNNEILNKFGIELDELNKKDLSLYNVNAGVKISKINKRGWIAQYTDIKEGFVITMIDDEVINSIEQFKEIVQSKRGRIFIEGRYPDKENSFLYAMKI